MFLGFILREAEDLLSSESSLNSESTHGDLLDSEEDQAARGDWLSRNVAVRMRGKRADSCEPQPRKPIWRSRNGIRDRVGENQSSTYRSVSTTVMDRTALLLDALPDGKAADVDVRKHTGAKLYSSR